MSLEAALRDRLLEGAAAELRAKIDQRVYPELAPTNATRPLVIYATVSDIRPRHLQGDGELSEARVSVDCYAETMGEALELSELVQSHLDTWRGVIDDRGVSIQDCYRGSRAMDSQRDGSVTDRRVALDYLISYTTT